MCLNVGLCFCACCLSMVQWLIQLKWNYLFVNIYIHTVFDLIWTDQWIDIIESVDVLIQFTPFAHLLCQHYDMLVVPHTPTPSFWCQTPLPCPWYKLKIKSVQVGKTFIPNLFVVCIFSFLKPLGMLSAAQPGTYSSSAAPGVGASTACPGSTPSTPSPAYTPVTPTTPAPPAPATNGNGGTMALTATTNWKGVLILVWKCSTHPTGQIDRWTECFLVMMLHRRICLLKGNEII